MHKITSALVTKYSPRIWIIIRNRVIYTWSTFRLAADVIFHPSASSDISQVCPRPQQWQRNTYTVTELCNKQFCEVEQLQIPTINQLLCVIGNWKHWFQSMTRGLRGSDWVGRTVIKKMAYWLLLSRLKWYKSNLSGWGKFLGLLTHSLMENKGHVLVRLMLSFYGKLGTILTDMLNTYSTISMLSQYFSFSWRYTSY